jgi:hypothetical protein
MAKIPSHEGKPSPAFQGVRDLTVKSVNSDQIIAQSRSTRNLQVSLRQGQSPGGVRYSRTVHTDEAGDEVLEQWVVRGLGQAWSAAELRPLASSTTIGSGVDILWCAPKLDFGQF